jgi:hypothetical protein
MALSPITILYCLVHVSTAVAQIATTEPGIASSQPAFSEVTSTLALPMTTATPSSFNPTATPAPVPSSGSLPPVGSIPRDFSPAGLQRLWDLVSTPKLFLTFLRTSLSYINLPYLSGRHRRASSIHHHTRPIYTYCASLHATGFIPNVVCTATEGCTAELEVPERVQVWCGDGGVSGGRRCEERRKGADGVGLGSEATW